MTGLELLAFYRDKWPTDKGAWFPGKDVRFREKSLFTDFSHRSWMSLLIYGLSGRMPTENEARIVEIFWSMGTSFPDPRLWNNRVSALAGTARSTASLGIAAATAISEAKVYGARPLYLSSLFLRKVRELEPGSKAFEDFIISKLKKDRYLPGFGRPVISEDERIAPFEKELEKHGFDKGPFIGLIAEIKTLLQERRYRIKPNIAVYGAALFGDMGFSAYESYLMVVLTFSAGFMPCYLDALEKPEGMLFPLQCEDIEYSGPSPRKLPQVRSSEYE